MTATLEWLVDRRHHAGPVIDQGSRPTCLSCAISSAHHHILGVAKCIEYLHYGSRKQPTGCGSIDSVQTVLATDGQPNESAWPYDPSIDEDVLSRIPPSPLSDPFHHADLVVNSAPDRARLIEQLRGGHLPVVGLVTTPGLLRLRSDVLTEPGPHMDGHAVLLVGAARYTGPDIGIIRPDDHLMCIQNSWGNTWGANGFGLIGPRAWDDMVLLSAHLMPT